MSPFGKLGRIRQRPVLTVELYTGVMLTFICVAWLAFIFFQRGDLWDETEHAHVAWLISRGRRPLDDFFQHHQPLLWSLLALYYRAGFSGTGVLIWGRMITVVAGVAGVASLLSLARYGRSADTWRDALSAWPGIAMLIALTVLMPRLFVSRPETVSMAAMFMGLAIWNFSSKPVATAMAGLLAGAACYSSPRFLLLGGLFLLLGEQSWRRWLCLTCGGLAFTGLYTWAAGFSLEKVWFNVGFSAYLQHVGTVPVGLPPRTSWGALVCPCMAMAAMIASLAPERRTRGALLLGYCVATFFGCQELAGMFRYSQAYAPYVTAVSLTGAWLGSRVSWTHRATVIGISFGLGSIFFVGFEQGSFPSFDFLATVRARAAFAASIPAGSKVLLYSPHSPIVVEDASFYGAPLNDGQNRLCEAVRGYHSTITLPECDFMKTLRTQEPYLTEKEISRAVSSNDVETAQRFVRDRYCETFFGRIKPFLWGVARRASAANISECKPLSP